MVNKIVTIRIEVEECDGVDMTNKEYVRDLVQYITSGDMEFTHIIEDNKEVV